MAIRDEFEAGASETSSVAEARVAQLCRGLADVGVSDDGVALGASIEAVSREFLTRWMREGGGQSNAAWAAQMLPEGEHLAAPNLMIGQSQLFALARFASLLVENAEEAHPSLGRLLGAGHGDGPVQLGAYSVCADGSVDPASLFC